MPSCEVRSNIPNLNRLTVGNTDSTEQLLGPCALGDGFSAATVLAAGSFGGAEDTVSPLQAQSATALEVIKRTLPKYVMRPVYISVKKKAIQSIGSLRSKRGFSIRFYNL